MDIEIYLKRLSAVVKGIYTAYIYFSFSFSFSDFYYV